MTRDVLMALARSEDTPVELLAKLAKDRDWCIRCAVAWNESTPFDILIELSEDKVRHVRRTAKKELERRNKQKEV